MGLFDQFPYTNFHELNLDWILKALRELEHTIDQFVAINALKYADPIQWNITSQYEKNTIVIDPQSGTAYISVQPVPAGVALTNTDYWSVVFDLEQFVTKANNNFTVRVEELTTVNATFPTPVNGWVIWGGVLYRALTNILAGDRYVVDSNIEKFTMEDVVGHPEDLLTTAKSNLVAAINEVFTTLNTVTGDLSDLTTTDKSNLVAAINEVLTTLTTVTGDLSDLTTTDKSNLVAAINEVLTTLTNVTGDLSDLTTTDKSNLVSAINELKSNLTTLSNNVGNLASLQTTDKSNLVAAINELLTTLTTSLTDFNNRLAAIEATIGSVLDRKFLFLGDSYYLGSTGISMSNQGWADFVIEFLGLTSDQYIKVSLNDVCGIPNKIATPGFSPSLGDHRSFKTILESCYNRIGQSVANTVTDVVVAGGYNDIDKNDILDGITQYATFAKAAFPNAKLWCAEIGNAGGPLTYSAARQKLFTIVRPTYNMCVRYGMNYIDSAEYILDDSDQFISNSQAHPTVAGYKLIGQAIANTLVGGTYIRPFVASAPLTITDPNWTIDTGDIKKTSNKYGEKTIISENGITLIAASPVTLGGAFQDLTIKCACTGILPSGFNQKPIVLAVAYNGAYTQSNVPVMLSFEYDVDASLIMRFRFTNITSFSISALRIRAFEYDYPCYRV